MILENSRIKYYLERGQSRFGESTHSRLGPPPLRFTHFVKKSSLYVLSSILCLPDQSVEQPRLPSPPCRHLEGDSTVLVSPHKQGPIVAEGLHRCHLGDRQRLQHLQYWRWYKPPVGFLWRTTQGRRSCLNHFRRAPATCQVSLAITWQYFATFSVHWIILCLRHCNNGGSWFQRRQVGVVNDHIEVVHA